MPLIQDGKCSLSPSVHSRMLYAKRESLVYAHLVNILLYHYLCVLLLPRLPTLVLCMVMV